MKYLVSIFIALALFVVFRPSHTFTFKTWFYLLLVHAPVPTLMFVLERTKKVRIHPVVCFLGVWIGGLVLGYLIGPFLIRILGGGR